MTIQRKIQLYKMAKARMKSKDDMICVAFSMLRILNIISVEEFQTIIADFHSRKPRRDSGFTKNKAWIGRSIWWEISPDGRKARIEFLDHIIKTLNKELHK